ncbi:PH domain-containing protein [Ruegeria atlantica]|uniref:PH domain-containing protein n=1 Tax=Ruegeria atlantica TaxID=81569 RepID=A0AA90YT96_9RHOB|nr:photosynthetic complex putative assembly protein PuhB [Ruegeria atlantica]NOE16653.1 PH domain-containing protein [Ruegeria atlantica]
MSHDDFAVEPVPGLPERPPEGEVILWQGRPHWWALAKSSVSVLWVAGYFAVLTLWRFVSVVDLMPLDLAIAASLPFVILGAVTCALLVLFSVIQARCTMYTLTNRRVAMRIGAALNITLNLPYSKIVSADLDLRKDGTGTIALTLQGPTRFSYLLCWPHVRPWRFNTQPALRCIPDAENVARIFADAAEAQVSIPRVERTMNPIAAE